MKGRKIMSLVLSILLISFNISVHAESIHDKNQLNKDLEKEDSENELDDQITDNEIIEEYPEDFNNEEQDTEQIFKVDENSQKDFDVKDKKIDVEKDEEDNKKVNADSKNKTKDNKKETKSITKDSSTKSNIVLEEGVRNKEVVQFKKDLTKLGFGGMNINDYFGSYTAKRVMDLQEYYGIEVTGKGDEQTLKVISDILNSPYIDGKRHDSVIELKEKLTSLGYGNMNINDLYGSFTVTRVKQFQRDHRLVENGIADPVTLAKIDELLNPVLQEGVRHPEVITLKENLIQLGFGGMNINDLYGSFTRKRVKQLQEYYGLKATGIADKDTLNEINKILNSPFREGQRDEAVKELKQKLTALGYGNMNINELYGSFTATRVRQFQRDHGLKVNGIADPVTLAKIEELLNPVLEQGVRNPEVITLKENLILLGFGGMNVNDLYGSFTEKKVRQLQEYYGLNVTGKGDQDTLDKIAEIVNGPYVLNNRHKDVIDIKRKLTRLGYGNMNINDLYGSFTVTRVKQFQRDNGLIVNGIVDPVTYDVIEEALNFSLEEGMKDKRVIPMKENLTLLGFGGMNINETFGSFTAKRVKQFQKYYGLTETGVADKATLDKLDEIVYSPFQKGSRHNDVIELKEKLTKLKFGNMNINDFYGSFTATRVKQFQRYYGLKDHGIADEVTWDKLNEILSSPFRQGQRHPDIIDLKEKLTKLKFGNMNINDLYGSFTQTRVEQFQRYYGLKDHGIADEVTWNKLNEILSSPFQVGQRHPDVIDLKVKLTNLGYGNMNINDLYGSFTEKRVKQFQKDHGLKAHGIVDEITLKAINEAYNKLASDITYNQYNISLDEAVKIQMKATPQTDKKEYAWVSKSYIDKNNRVTATALNVRTQPTTADVNSNKILGTLPKGTKVEIVGEKGNWYAIKYKNNAWVHAIEKDVRYYLDPNNFINDEKLRFQFLDLGSISGATAKQLNEYLKDKGIFKGKGQAFIDAGRAHGINEIYLISHALLETGNGTSKLATGVKYEDKTVYNMYGIGAYDSCPIDCGAERAYNEGWTTPEKAITGGVKFIGNNYIKQGLNTIYKMRWNPEAMASNGRYGKQYATDIGWASKQVTTMYNLYKSIEVFNLKLDIPVYK